jgi:hypothetical protein
MTSIYLIYKFNDDVPDEVAVLCDTHAKDELPKYRNVTDIDQLEAGPNQHCLSCNKP